MLHVTSAAQCSMFNLYIYIYTYVTILKQMRTNTEQEKIVYLTQYKCLHIRDWVIIE